MKPAATATIVAATLSLMPAAAVAAQSTTTTRAPAQSTTTTRESAQSTTTTRAASATTPTSVPATTITTSAPGGSSTAQPLAPARSDNIDSARAALTAYASYLQLLVSSESTSQADDATYVDTVESGCKSALAPLTQAPDEVKPAVKSTLTLLGKEIGDDLTVSYDQVAEAPFQRLATVLEHLSWVGGGRNSEIITGYVAAETALLSLPQSSLCQDVLLAATKPTLPPTATHAFLIQYATGVAGASAALGAFLSLLSAYETAAEKPIVQRIAVLAHQFARDSKADLQVSGQQLTASLETS